MGQFEYGAIVLAIGMTVVMTALISLSIIMGLMKKVFYKDPAAKNSVPPVADNPIEEPQVEEKPKNNAAIIATISAAVAAYTGQEELNFNIISVKRLGTSRWYESGKQAVIQSQVSNKM